MSLAAALSMGGSLIGGLIGNQGIKKQNAANAKQAKLNRDFQERMSSTSHQRAVTDLRAAGLNPILSATKGGASTPSGAQANIQNALEPMANSAKDTMQMAANIALTEAQTKKIQKETEILSPKGTLYNQMDKIIQKTLPDSHSALGELGKTIGSTLYNVTYPKSKNPSYIHSFKAKANAKRKAYLNKKGN